jgi:uncharacterized protein HemX
MNWFKHNKRKIKMKKLLVVALGLLVAGTVTVSAAKGQKKAQTPEQQKLKTEMTTKYDANKDGKVDEQEAAKIDRADKKKMKEAGVRLGSKKKK